MTFITVVRQALASKFPNVTQLFGGDLYMQLGSGDYVILREMFERVEPGLYTNIGINVTIYDKGTPRRSTHFMYDNYLMPDGRSLLKQIRKELADEKAGSSLISVLAKWLEQYS
jgi:hypothetical protein